MLFRPVDVRTREILEQRSRWIDYAIKMFRPIGCLGFKIVIEHGESLP